MFLVYDTPSGHPRISVKELKFIQNALAGQQQEGVVSLCNFHQAVTDIERSDVYMCVHLRVCVYTCMYLCFDILFKIHCLPAELNSPVIHPCFMACVSGSGCSINLQCRILYLVDMFTNLPQKHTKHCNWHQICECLLNSNE